MKIQRYLWISVYFKGFVHSLLRIILSGEKRLLLYFMTIAKFRLSIANNEIISIEYIIPPETLSHEISFYYDFDYDEDLGIINLYIKIRSPVN